LTRGAKDEEPAEVVEQTAEVITSEDAEAADVTQAASVPAAGATEVAAIELEETQPMAAIRLQLATEEEQDPAPNSLADQLLEAEPAVLDIPQHVAYEEYLKDTSEPLQALDAEDGDEVEMPGSAEPVAKIDASGDLQIEMDTKNAHVWNELGNVYFNTSAYDDAIVAYSKAIELDRWFAWPYSNLALAYVQKRRFVEAILLYQRSIELFSSDKDKAISWNRLGNVYRRLNDYENAIAAYQRADALDPDNSTLSLQSRFSLLGNYAMEQKPSYVS
jgi:tetratricopeptide (TPR) repeat protein